MQQLDPFSFIGYRECPHSLFAGAWVSRFNTLQMEHVLVEPRNSKPLANVIFLHGLGASGHDFEPVAPQLQDVLPMRWVLPHAPEMPVTINGGYRMPAWYDLTDLQRRDGVDWATVEKTANAIRGLLIAERDAHPDMPLILGGFSQGAAISLLVGLDSPVPLAGVVSLSGYLLARDGVGLLEASKGFPPVFMGHGAWDDVVPAELALTSLNELNGIGVGVEWHSYPMMHSVCPREIDDLQRWMAARLKS